MTRASVSVHGSPGTTNRDTADVKKGHDSKQEAGSAPGTHAP